MSINLCIGADHHLTSKFSRWICHAATDPHWTLGDKTTSEQWRASRRRRRDNLDESAEPSEWKEWRLEAASPSESRQCSERATTTTSHGRRRGNGAQAIQDTLRTWPKTQLNQDSSDGDGSWGEWTLCTGGLGATRWGQPDDSVCLRRKTCRRERRFKDWMLEWVNQ